MNFVTPYNGDPQDGHLSTPISDSGFTKLFIGNLPAYRKGLTPSRRGLEIGMAHGYFLYGPFALCGPARGSDAAGMTALLATAGLIMVLTIALSLQGEVKTGNPSDPHAPDVFRTASGWSDFAGSFFVGASGGAFVAYLLYSNLAGLNAIFTGLINYS
jgi:photosystem I subunit XI